MSDEKTETEALATNRQPQKALTALADLLQRCGHSPEQAQAIATQTIRQQTVIDPGHPRRAVGGALEAGRETRQKETRAGDQRRRPQR